MREITSHVVNPANDKITLTVIDEPGHGGACHEYAINVPGQQALFLMFQNGPISEDGNGVNGITHEVLLAVLIDRLEGFQAGKYANAYNEKALMSLRIAQATLQERTKERMARGVEGTHKI
jgi:hypothetical protein